VLSAVFEKHSNYLERKHFVYFITFTISYLLFLMVYLMEGELLTFPVYLCSPRF